jgi:hypothetical protein
LAFAWTAWRKFYKHYREDSNDRDRGQDTAYMKVTNLRVWSIIAKITTDSLIITLVQFFFVSDISDYRTYRIPGTEHILCPRIFKLDCI